MDICKSFVLDTPSFETFSVLAPTFVGRPEPNISTLPNEPVEVDEPRKSPLALMLPDT